mmetsp:Transcript_1614/g.3692  ORF Transcript_1614/g.3692 Transcript_1614/m.3692 type:complete len:321 (+) Transcript_1614:269-1231(+)
MAIRAVLLVLAPPGLPIPRAWTAIPRKVQRRTVTGRACWRFEAWWKRRDRRGQTLRSCRGHVLLGSVQRRQRFSRRRHGHAAFLLGAVRGEGPAQALLVIRLASRRFRRVGAAALVAVLVGAGARTKRLAAHNEVHAPDIRLGGTRNATALRRGKAQAHHCELVFFPGLQLAFWAKVAMVAVGVVLAAAGLPKPSAGPAIPKAVQPRSYAWRPKGNGLQPWRYPPREAAHLRVVPRRSLLDQPHLRWLFRGFARGLGSHVHVDLSPTQCMCRQRHFRWTLLRQRPCGRRDLDFHGQLRLLNLLHLLLRALDELLPGSRSL